MTKLKKLAERLRTQFDSLVSRLASGVPSLVSTEWEATGLKPIDEGIPVEFAEQLDHVVAEAYICGISVNGDFYRANAAAVAAAASMGFLTTRTVDGYGRVYRPTLAGMAWVQEGIAPE